MPECSLLGLGILIFCFITVHGCFTRFFYGNLSEPRIFSSILGTKLYGKPSYDLLFTLNPPSIVVYPIVISRILTTSSLTRFFKPYYVVLGRGGVILRFLINVLYKVFYDSSVGLFYQ